MFGWNHVNKKGVLEMCWVVCVCVSRHTDVAFHDLQKTSTHLKNESCRHSRYQNVIH